MSHCCGDGHNRFCCPEVYPAVTAAQPSTSGLAAAAAAAAGDDRFPQHSIPLIAGISVVVVVVIIGILLIGCFVCRCCPANKRRRTRKQSATSLCTMRGIREREDLLMSSTVIAAETTLLSPPPPPSDHVHRQRCRSDGNGVVVGGTTKGLEAVDEIGLRHPHHLHCGCSNSSNWSQNTSRSTVLDVDSIGNSFYQQNDPDLPWLSDSDNHSNCGRNARRDSKKKQNHGPAFIRPSQNQSVGDHSTAACLESFHPKLVPHHKSEDSDNGPRYLKYPISERERHQLVGSRQSPLRAVYGPVVHQDRCRRDGSFVVSGLPLDCNRQKRDSGVLVEEQDGEETTSSSFGLPPSEGKTNVNRPGLRIGSRWHNNFNAI